MRYALNGRTDDGRLLTALELARIAKAIVAALTFDEFKHFYAQNIYKALNAIADAVHKKGNDSGVKTFLNNVFKKDKQFKVENKGELIDSLEKALLGDHITKAAEMINNLRTQIQETRKTLGEKLNDIEKKMKSYLPPGTKKADCE